ncbi:sulfatase-like hydrolase/transferase [Sabulilitoribacter arenilitoris]|uniref:Sulfatase-like hydrolase/transferase n=1 Tax=Wocania arenilitoris TaxID=2044858 RepID=A0AAE3ENJ0_9FLAO|nr:sulfatase-like hydrolase/transferase [Wocania arenilitoris]MCF7568256.1 sulfatase-like hydrolase/transferase [Wocania arenilitoris]
MKKYKLPFLLFLFFSINSFSQSDEKITRPNLLFILSDDQRDNSFSGMGHPWVETPNVDKLLSKGIRFKNAYIAEPTCMPSRAAIMLGNHERINRNGFSSDHKTTKSQWEDSYPALLKKANYRTGYVGKWHILLDGLNFSDMFDFWDGHIGHGPFYFERTNPDGIKQTVTTNRHHTDNALKFLRNNNNDKPFCLSVAYATPHGSKVQKMHKPLDQSASEDERLTDHPIYGGKYRNLDIPYPLQNPDNPYNYIPREVMNQDLGRNKTYVYDYDPVSNKEHHFRYFQMITEIDQMVGELMAELEKQGLSGNTIIVYGSDHGVLMGEYGMGGKGLLYDLTSKFPCFVYDPTAPQKMRGLSSTELVSSLDITTTLLDYAGVKPAPFMSGRSLKPLVQGEALNVPWRNGLYLENMYTGRDTPLQEGYVDGEWKYIRFLKVSHPYSIGDISKQDREPVLEMLFNLKDDPEEINNLIQDPRFKQKLEELRHLCDSNLKHLLKNRNAYTKHYNIE